MKNYTPLILIAVSIGLFFVVIDPQYNEVKDLQQEHKENEELLVKANDLREKRDELLSRYNNISSDERELLLKVLPETVDNVRLILNIDNIARNYGIVLRDIQIEGAEDEAGNSQIIDSTRKGYGVITLSFGTSAPYGIFKSFMSDLENSLRIVDITDFEVATSPESNVYNYSITLDTYWLR